MRNTQVTLQNVANLLLFVAMCFAILAFGLVAKGTIDRTQYYVWIAFSVFMQLPTWVVIRRIRISTWKTIGKIELLEEQLALELKRRRISK